MKKTMWGILANIIIVLIFLTGVASGNNCDSSFNVLEVNYCKTGQVEYKVGLKTEKDTQCVDFKKLAVKDCKIEALSTSPDIQ